MEKLHILYLMLALYYTCTNFIVKMALFKILAFQIGWPRLRPRLNITSLNLIRVARTLSLVVFDCQQVPELVVWSSLLPEVTRHMFHVCAPEQPRRWSECPDAMHMGRTLQDGFCDLLLSDLSDRGLSGAPPRSRAK